MHPVRFNWTFHARQVDDSGKYFLFKGRCVLRGDLQERFEDFDPENIYAPVAAHEQLRMFLATAPAQVLVLESADVNNAYRYIWFDMPINMEEPTNPIQIL